MVNLGKSVVCTMEGKVLKHRWHSGGYFTTEGKGLKALLSIDHAAMMKIPVHSIGLLSFFRPYIADFAVRTEPLRCLLAKSHAQWEEAHTKLVKEIITKVLEGLPVMNFDA